MNCKISVIFAFVLHIYLHWCKARYFISGAKELLSADSPYITFLKFVTFSSLLIEKGSHKLHTMPTVLVVFWARPSRSFFKIFISYVCIYIYIYQKNVISDIYFCVTFDHCFQSFISLVKTLGNLLFLWSILRFSEISVFFKS